MTWSGAPPVSDGRLRASALRVVLEQRRTCLSARCREKIMRFRPAFHRAWFHAVGTVTDAMPRQVLQISLEQRCHGLFVQERSLHPTGSDLLHGRGKADLPRR